MDGKKLEYKGEEALKEIERLTAKADEVQKNILKEILSRNSETEYLIKYMKGSKNVLEFKRGVPVITYKAIRPYIQRIVNGEDSSLITGDSITEMLSRYYYFLFFCELINELVWILFLGFL
jgi:auxin responsive GH3 family protein